jgi:protein O-GlcNAc transferase
MKEKKIIEMIQQNELNKARSELVKKLKRSPANIGLLNLLAMVQIKLGFITEAIESFKKSILINPKQDDTLNNLISAYQEIGDISAAIEIIEKNINHCDDGIIFKLAYFYNKQNKFDKAIDSYKKLESNTWVNINCTVAPPKQKRSHVF